MSYINFIKLSKFIDGERPTAEKFNSIFAFFERRINELSSSFSSLSDSGEVQIIEGQDTLTFDFRKKWATQKDTSSVVLNSNLRGNDISNLNQLIGSASNLNPLSLSGETTINDTINSNEYQISLNYHVRAYIGAQYNVVDNPITFLNINVADNNKLTNLKKPNEALTSTGDYKFLNLIEVNVDGTSYHASNTILVYTPFEYQASIQYTSDAAWVNGKSNPSNATFNVIPDLNTPFAQAENYNLAFSGPDADGFYTVDLPQLKYQQVNLNEAYRGTAELDTSNINYNKQLTLPQQLIDAAGLDETEYAIPSNFMFLKSFEPFSEWRNIEYRYVSSTQFKAKLPTTIGTQCLNYTVQMFLITVGNDITSSLNDLQIKHASHNHDGSHGEPLVSVHSLTDLYKEQSAHNKYYPSLNSSNYFSKYLHRDGYRYGSDSQNGDNDFKGDFKLANAGFGRTYKLFFGRYETIASSVLLEPGIGNRDYNLDSWIGGYPQGLVLNTSQSGSLFGVSGLNIGLYSATKNVLAVYPIDTPLKGSRLLTDSITQSELDIASNIVQEELETRIYAPNALNIETSTNSGATINVESKDINITADNVLVYTGNFQVVSGLTTNQDEPIYSEFQAEESAIDVQFNRVQEDTISNDGSSYQEGFEQRNNIPINRKGNIYYYFEFQLPDEIKGARTFSKVEVQSLYTSTYNPFYKNGQINNLSQLTFDYFPEQFKTVESYNRWLLDGGYINPQGDLAFNPDNTDVDFNKLYPYHLAYRMAFKEHMFFNFKNGIRPLPGEPGNNENNEVYYYRQNIAERNIFPIILHADHLALFKDKIASIDNQENRARVDIIEWLVNPFRNLDWFDERQSGHVYFPLASGNDNGNVFQEEANSMQTQEKQFMTNMYPIIWTKVWSEQPLTSFSFDYVREAVQSGTDTSIRLLDRGFLFNFDFDKENRFVSNDADTYSEKPINNMPHTFQMYKLRNLEDRFNLNLSLPKFSYYDMFGITDTENGQRIDYLSSNETGSAMIERLRALTYNTNRFEWYDYALNISNTFYNDFKNTYEKHYFEEDDINIVFGNGFFLKRRDGYDISEAYDPNNLSQYSINSADRYDIILDMDNRLGLPNNDDGSDIYQTLKTSLYTDRYNKQTNQEFDKRYAYGIDHGHFVDSSCNLSISVKKRDSDNFSKKQRSVNIVYSDFFNDWGNRYKSDNSVQSIPGKQLAPGYHTKLFENLNQDFSSLTDDSINTFERYMINKINRGKISNWVYKDSDDTIETGNTYKLNRIAGDSDGDTSTFFSALFFHFRDLNTEPAAIINTTSLASDNIPYNISVILQQNDNILTESSRINEQNKNRFIHDCLMIKLVRNPAFLTSQQLAGVYIESAPAHLQYNLQAHNPYFSFPFGLISPFISFSYEEEYRRLNNVLKNNQTMFKNVNKILPSIYKFNFNKLIGSTHSQYDAEIFINFANVDNENLARPEHAIYTRPYNSELNEGLNKASFYFYADYTSSNFPLGLMWKFIKDKA